MEDRIRYVYKIFDKLNKDKFYIGTTFDINKRWSQHKRDSNSKKLNADIIEFGSQDFDIEILFSGSEDEANAEEIKLIKELRPHYNNKNDRGGKSGSPSIGEENHNSKLKETDIINICIRVNINKEKVSDVHKDYPHISNTLIYNIIAGEGWEHIERPIRKRFSGIGEENGRAKIKEQDVIEICNRIIINKEPIEQVHKDFNFIDIHTIYDIIHGNTWKQVKRPIIKAADNTIGENNGNSKLTEAMIKEMCNRVIIKNESKEDVLKDYPISKEMFAKILVGDYWKHVDRPIIKKKNRFTKNDVINIRLLSKRGKTLQEIANLNEYTIYNIRSIQKVINRETYNSNGYE